MINQVFLLKQIQVNSHWEIYREVDGEKHRICLVEDKPTAQLIVDALRVWPIVEKIASIWKELNNVEANEEKLQGAPVFVRRTHTLSTETLHQSFCEVLQTLLSAMKSSI